MRILWVTQILAGRPGAGYVSTQVNMTRELERLGHRVRLVLGDEPVHLGGPSAVYWPSSTPLQKLAFQVRTCLAVLRSGADVVLLDREYQVHAVCLAAQLRDRASRPAIVLDVRTLPVEGEAGLAGRIRWWRFRSAVRWASRWLDGVTTITPAMSSYLVGTGDLAPRALLGEWSSGADASIAPVEEGDAPLAARIGALPRPVGVYIGVLSPDRGLEELVDAVADSAFSGSLVLVGDGPLFEPLRQRSSAVADGKVILTGRLPHERSKSLLSLCDYGVSPLPGRIAWNVSSPLKVLEYVAAGLPVAATDIPAHRDMLRGYDAVAFADGFGASALAAACRRAASRDVRPGDRDLVMERFSWSVVARTLARLLAQAAAY